MSHLRLTLPAAVLGCFLLTGGGCQKEHGPKPLAVANAYPNPVNEGAAVILDGTGSTSPGEYLWRQEAGPTVTIYDPRVLRTGFTAPEVDRDTDLTFRLVVGPVPYEYDADEDYDYDENAPTGISSGYVTVTVRDRSHESEPLPGVAVDPNPAREEQLVTLDGSGSSDPDGDPLIWRWTQTEGPAVVLNTPEAAVTTFMAPSIDEGTDLTFFLTVDDGTFSVPTSVTVTVLDSLANQ